MSRKIRLDNQRVREGRAGREGEGDTSSPEVKQRFGRFHYLNFASVSSLVWFD